MRRYLLFPLYSLILLAWGVFVVYLTVALGYTPWLGTLKSMFGRLELLLLTTSLHAMLFTILTIIMWRALSLWVNALAALLVAMLICFMLGTTTEFAQYFINGRDISLADLLANWLGVFVGGFPISAFLSLRRGKPQRR